MTEDHEEIQRIEQRVAQMDIGRMAVRVYQGALEEAEGKRRDAFWATTAYFLAMFHDSEIKDEDRGKDKEGEEDNDEEKASE